MYPMKEKIRCEWYLPFVLVVLSAFVIYACSSREDFQIRSESTTIAQLEEGDDWSLPSWVVKKEGTGLYDYPSVIQQPELYAVNLTWRELNPAENIYNWQKLEQALSSGHKIWLRIFASDTLHCPDWLGRKYSNLRPLQYPAEGGSYGETITGYSPGRFYPIWQADFDSAFSKFLSAFGDKGFAAHPNLVFMYAPGAWRWNEWEVIFTEHIRSELGSVELFYHWFKRHIDNYANAFKNDEHKLVFTGYPQMDKCEAQIDFAVALNDVTTGRNLLTDYAVSKGMSVRVGALEYFNGYSHIPSWGAPAIAHNGKRYQRIDLNHPLHRDRLRILATENEALGDENMISGTGSYYFIKMLTLKSLQLGVNWLNMQDKNYLLAPDVIEYARKTMGKSPAESPDAWVVLREWYDASYRAASAIDQVPGSKAFFEQLQLPYRNWEKYLAHHDFAPGGVTVATQKLEGSSPFLQSNGTSYEALRTNVKTGDKFICFTVLDDFLFDNSKPVEIKVTYLDNNSTQWFVEYDGASGSSSTATITNSNDGKWKTLSFQINDAKFRNRIEGNFDFRIVNQGAADLTVRQVRLVKLTP